MTNTLAQAWRGWRGWTEAAFRSLWPNHWQGDSFKVRFYSWVWLGVRLKLCFFRSELHGRPLELFMCSVLKRQGYGEGFRWGPIFLLLLLNLSSMTYFQVDFTISGLTCSDASIAFDTDFEWEKGGGWTLWSFKFWCLVMHILCKVITETTTSDYSYPVRVACDDTAIQAPSSLLTNLICENFYLGLRKL